MMVDIAELLHKYEVPPLAVRVVLSPLQIETTPGEMEAVGLELTVTVDEADAEQLLEPITVTE